MAEPVLLELEPVAATARLRPAGWRPLRVALVNMPFASHRRPSLQLGLLAAIARRAGHHPYAQHFNLDFASVVGPDLYDVLCEQRGLALGDWVFARVAFEDRAPDPEHALATRLTPEIEGSLADVVGSRHVEETLVRLRTEAAPRFVEKIAEQPAWDSIDVVGFTSTFQQTVPSLALARALKRRRPDLITLFGGANLDGVMGLEAMERFEVIDLALQGEADVSFPALLDRLAAGEPLDRVPGLLRRVDARVRRGPPAGLTQDLDALPTPDFDDFFDRAERLGLVRVAARRAIDLPIETARGCWWGEKRHCTFCGLNGQTMAYRSKSPDRVLDEMASLAARHRSFRFEAVDNILDRDYLDTLLPRIIASGSTYDLFYEVKANLTREQLARLHAAGVRRIQPGIESLSSRVLRLMKKGIRASDNVNLLRWARSLGVFVSWNLLWGFPHEQVEDYAQQARLVPQLVHLQPPGGAGPIWIERFSPLFTETTEFPRHRMTPERSLSSIYPSDVDLDRLAYFFDADLADTLPADTYAELQGAVRAWKALDALETPPTLSYYASPGFVQVVDRRNPRRELTHTLTGLAAQVYLSCADRPRSARRLVHDDGLGGSEQEVAETLDGLVEQQIAMVDGDRYLSLALPAPAGTVRR